MATQFLSLTRTPPTTMAAKAPNWINRNTRKEIRHENKIKQQKQQHRQQHNTKKEVCSKQVITLIMKQGSFRSVSFRFMSFRMIEWVKREKEIYWLRLLLFFYLTSISHNIYNIHNGLNILNGKLSDLFSVVISFHARVVNHWKLYDAWLIFFHFISNQCMKRLCFFLFLYIRHSFLAWNSCHSRNVLECVTWEYISYRMVNPEFNQCACDDVAYFVRQKRDSSSISVLNDAHFRLMSMKQNETDWFTDEQFSFKNQFLIWTIKPFRFGVGVGLNNKHIKWIIKFNCIGKSPTKRWF